MKFTNLTRGNEIGANSYLLDFGGDGRIILDAGMHPALEGVDALPDFEPATIDTIDAIFISHAHHDHLGALPVLMREQAQARIFMSAPTCHLADAMLHNSAQIMLKQSQDRGIPPLFGHHELDPLSRLWQGCALKKRYSIQGALAPDPREPLTFQFHDAGHILGSVGIELNHRGKRILYTGDVNFSPQCLMRPADFPREGIDTLIIETTRGAQSVEGGYSRETELDHLVKGIQETFDQGGAVLIPIFALGKTQEILSTLHFFQKKGRLPQCPLYIGGLSRKLSLIYDRFAEKSCRNYPNLHLLSHIAPEIINGRHVHNFRLKGRHLYLISSGMMTPKTLSNVLAQRMLPIKHHSLFFVGYCSPESPASRLRETARGDSVAINPEEGEQPVLCRVKYFDLTSHAQREDLLDYIIQVNPRRCLLVHGDPPALEWFQGQLHTLAPQIEVIIPPPGEALPLD